VRDDFTAAPNARMTQAVVYGVDPRGFGTFTAITASLNRSLNGQRAVVTGPTFGGVAQAPQKFRGAASLGQTRPMGQPASEMGDQISTSMADPIMAAFLARGSA
jgi:hypothetical protein